ncbi:hypothetical protein TTHERM_000438959 (macronuclear) [Tetrahymena thermophila SB210]|uniref:Uncharacterized protein n=1 Tax=Tetrahymena thermophila (strain SB210) TaxID=312017 RepID=W7XJ93_TETTS|nr:hypothetical protein TTHERM_000438959 [Tetrahymena thermophila SB210]EWS73964.1 hypothetical protein TTHERM_000438959 [Tetrahymena thermophila SB210]|eukprot:XP_012653505.1 hypothetical protein TTHERM_000438959 [Tetrahymena thermophila SB210]
MNNQADITLKNQTEKLDPKCQVYQNKNKAQTQQHLKNKKVVHHIAIYLILKPKQTLKGLKKNQARSQSKLKHQNEKEKKYQGYFTFKKANFRVAKRIIEKRFLSQFYQILYNPKSFQKIQNTSLDKEIYYKNDQFIINLQEISIPLIQKNAKHSIRQIRFYRFSQQR